MIMNQPPEALPGVTLVGGGPGAWDLITVRGMRALQDADVILADHPGPSTELEKLCDLSGKTLIDAASHAARVAAYAVTGAGAQPSYPDLNDSLPEI